MMRGAVPLKICLAVVLCCFLAPPLCAQVSPTARDRAIREARELARRGDRDAAIRTMESLYARAPMDGVIAQTLAGFLAEGGDLEKAKRVLTEYTAVRTDDAQALSMLAGLYFRSGEKTGGMEVLERIVARAPKEMWPYQVALDAMVGTEMKDEMMAIISRARSATGDSTAFAMDAAGLHRDAGRFGAAAREYLRAGLAKNISSDIATDYLLSMAQNDEARPAVIDALERASSIALFIPTVTRGLAEIYLLDRECGVALEMISQLVEADPSSAGALIAFARKAAQAGCFGECAGAYGLVSDHVRQKHKRAEYLVEKGRCEVAGGAVDEAMDTFESIAREYRTYKAADDALMERALILRGRGELEGAIAEAQRIMASQYAENVYRAILFQADCHVLKGDLEAAFDTYDRVGSDWTAACAQEAYFNMGEINLYRGEFDDAQAYYNVALREYPDEPRANDAIDRLLVIKSCGGEGSYAPELTEFARALLLRRQGNLQRAADILRDLGDGGDESPVRVESLGTLAEIYVEGGSLEKAVRTYQLIGDSLDTPGSAAALEAVGDILLHSGKVEEAIKVYEDVILRFPESVSAGDARRKIDIASRGIDDEA